MLPKGQGSSIAPLHRPSSRRRVSFALLFLVVTASSVALDGPVHARYFAYTEGSPQAATFLSRGLWLSTTERTATGTITNTLVAPAGGSDPTWSPYGTKIAYIIRDGSVVSDSDGVYLTLVAIYKSGHGRKLPPQPPPQPPQPIRNP